MAPSENVSLAPSRHTSGAARRRHCEALGHHCSLPWLPPQGLLDTIQCVEQGRRQLQQNVAQP